jgi:DNA polymerase-3 subunit delta'
LIDEESHIDTFIFKIEGNDLGIKEFRELQTYLNLSSQSKYKIIIIQNIERLSVPLQNAMLKILEEPPSNVVFLLSSSNLNNVLETIISRCRIYKTSVCTDEQVDDYLNEKFPELEKNIHQNIVFLAGGRIGLAYKLAENPEVYQETAEWLEKIEFLNGGAEIYEALQFAEELSALERSLIKQFLTVMILFYRKTMSENSNNENVNLIADKIDKCVETLDLVAQNVNVKICLEVLFLHCFTTLGNITNQ